MQTDWVRLRQRLCASLTFKRAEKARPPGRRRYLNNLILHFRPATVPDTTLRLTLSWMLDDIPWLGGHFKTLLRKNGEIGPAALA